MGSPVLFSPPQAGPLRLVLGFPDADFRNSPSKQSVYSPSPLGRADPSPPGLAQGAVFPTFAIQAGLFLHPPLCLYAQVILPWEWPGNPGALVTPIEDTLDTNGFLCTWKHAPPVPPRFQAHEFGIRQTSSLQVR